jgi:hypothetical protein
VTLPELKGGTTACSAAANLDVVSQYVGAELIAGSFYDL